MQKKNDIELSEQWAKFLAENPNEMQRLCDRIYELFTEEIRNRQERLGAWRRRL